MVRLGYRQECLDTRIRVFPARVSTRPKQEIYQCGKYVSINGSRIIASYKFIWVVSFLFYHPRQEIHAKAKNEQDYYGVWTPYRTGRTVVRF